MAHRTPPTLVFYVSGHGFGHASRDIEVVNAVLARRRDVSVVVRTSAPRWLFDLTVRGSVTVHPVETDTGVVQRDSLTLDVDATLAEASRFHASFDRRVREEADALRRLDPALVVSDVPALAFAAAEAAGVRSFALANFTWDWIYDAYVAANGDHGWLPERIRAAQRLATTAWRLPMHGGFEGFGSIVDVPLIARRSRRTRHEVRSLLGLDAARPAVLASFGGFGLDGLPLDAIAARGNLAVVTADVPTSHGAVDRPVVRRTAAGTLVVDERALYAAGYRYEDIVAAVDVVCTKPGYGIVAECIAHGTALLYTSRGWFPEYEVLVREMPRYLRCAFIERAGLMEGRWERQAADLLSQARVAAPPTDGAEVVAAAIVDLLDGR